MTSDVDIRISYEFKPFPVLEKFNHTHGTLTFYHTRILWLWWMYWYCELKHGVT